MSSLLPRFHRLLVLALAMVVMLHGFAAAYGATRGPAHVHRSAKGAQLVLLDVRRSPAAAPAARGHLAGEPAHGHAHVAHHHHAPGDPSIVRLAKNPADALSASDDDATIAALAALIALLPEPPIWQDPLVGHVATPAGSWAVLTHEGDPPDRPPRTV